MPSIEIISDTLDFAKELAWSLELSSQAPSEEEILAALQVMDAQLVGAGENVRALFSIQRAFTVPDCAPELELMDDSEVMASILEPSIIKARIHRFEWMGSLVTTGFGVRMYGIDVLEPVRLSKSTAFVPLEDITLRLSA